jgi:hypothetical protein
MHFEECVRIRRAHFSNYDFPIFHAAIVEKNVSYFNPSELAQFKSFATRSVRFDNSELCCGGFVALSPSSIMDEGCAFDRTEKCLAGAA